MERALDEEKAVPGEKATVRLAPRRRTADICYFLKICYSEPMDATDRKILEILRKKARIPLKGLSQEVNLSLPATSERLHKLEQAGYIKEYAAILDPQKFNKEFTCFCMVEFSRHDIDYDRDFVDFVMHRPEILECHRITGTYEYMLKIVTTSVKAMEQLIEVMRIEKRVINTSTITILTSIKNEVSIGAD